MGDISEKYEGAVRAGEEGSSFVSCKGKAISEERDRLCWRWFYSQATWQQQQAVEKFDLAEPEETLLPLLIKSVVLV